MDGPACHDCSQELAKQFGFVDVDGTDPTSHPPYLRERMNGPPAHWVVGAPHTVDLAKPMTGKL